MLHLAKLIVKEGSDEMRHVDSIEVETGVGEAIGDVAALMESARRHQQNFADLNDRFPQPRMG